RRLLAIESAPNRSAINHPGHVPKRHTPMAAKEDFRALNKSQTKRTNSHSTSAGPLIQSKNRCSAEPCAMPGRHNESSLETIQIAAGIPRANTADTVQHRARIGELRLTSIIGVGSPIRFFNTLYGVTVALCCCLAGESANKIPPMTPNRTTSVKF